MPEPNSPLSALKAIVQSAEFVTVKQAVDALEPAIMLETAVAPHLNAFRVGMTALAASPLLRPAEEEPGAGGGEEPPAE